MKVNEIRNLTTEEINAKIKESKEELFNYVNNLTTKAYKEVASYRSSS